MTHRAATYRSSDGLTLFYRDYGDPESGRTPVICLPGLTRNSRDFDAIAEHIGRERRVICCDFRGRGHSDRDPNPQNYQPGRYAEDTIELLDALGIAQVAVIGTSLGGIVAMVLAHGHGERLAAVVLNDIGPELDPRGVARIAQYVGAPVSVQSWDEAVAQCRASYEIAFPDVSDARWIAYTRAGWREDDHGIPRPDYDPAIRNALQSGGVLQADPWKLFDALRAIPTLVLRGELSDLLSAEIVEKMQARKPDLTVAVVHNRGHAPLLDEPDAVAAIDALLAQVPS